MTTRSIAPDPPYRLETLPPVKMTCCYLVVCMWLFVAWPPAESTEPDFYLASMLLWCWFRAKRIAFGAAG